MQIGSDHKTEKVIQADETGPYDTAFTWYKAGLAVTGPNQEIRVWDVNIRVNSSQ